MVLQKSFFIQHFKPVGVFDHFYIELRSLSKDLYEFNETKKRPNERFQQSFICL